MTSNDVVADLKRTRNRLQQRLGIVQVEIENLSSDIAALDAMIRRYGTEPQLSLQTPASPGRKAQENGATVTVRTMFNEHPNMDWTPAAIEKYLENRRKEGTLTSEGKLRNAAWSAIRGLLRDGHITKLELGSRRVAYRRTASPDGGRQDGAEKENAAVGEFHLH